jgi:SAM-dependent methyltransferase
MDDSQSTPLAPPEVAAQMGLEGRTLEGELDRVMSLLSAAGVEYPPGYLEQLIQKCKVEKLLFFYPVNLVRAGYPGIRQHIHYPEILQRQGSFLDFGCGIGDDVRALAADGYPCKCITGFDINWHSINLGFDLYLDRDAWIDRFVVEKQFPYPPPYFDVIFSGNVIHALFTAKAITRYLSNAYAALSPGGVFFGSTLGGSQGCPTFLGKKLLLREELEALLTDAGFVEVEVTEIDSEWGLEFSIFAVKEF